jgi:hypothetical protein
MNLETGPLDWILAAVWAIAWYALGRYHGRRATWRQWAETEHAHGRHWPPLPEPIPPPPEPPAPPAPRPLRDITESEWNAAEWIEITNLSDSERVFIRGRTLTDPPRGDGFVYIEALPNPGDQERRWVRAKTPA